MFISLVRVWRRSSGKSFFCPDRNTTPKMGTNLHQRKPKRFYRWTLFHYNSEMARHNANLKISTFPLIGPNCRPSQSSCFNWGRVRRLGFRFPARTRTTSRFIQAKCLESKKITLKTSLITVC